MTSATHTVKVEDASETQRIFEERIDFEAWAADWFPNSNPPQAAWVGWHARSTRDTASPGLLEALRVAERALTSATGIIVEFGNLNGFRNLSDEELGRAVLGVAKQCADAMADTRATLSKLGSAS